MKTLDCPQCGVFVLSFLLAERLKKEDKDRLFRLTCMIRQYRLKDQQNGKSGIYGLFPENFQPGEGTVDKFLARWWKIDDLLQEFPKPTELVDRVLLNLSRCVQHPMQNIVDDNQQTLEYLMFCPRGNLYTQVNFMVEMGLIRRSTNGSDMLLTISPKGWDRIAELSITRRESIQAFVAMWFNADTDRFYEKGIEPGITDAGFTPRIIKNVEHNNKICDEIVAEIRKSKFVVADFTAGCCNKCETCEQSKDCTDKVRPRGGVYFEAGFAMGLGIPVIWTIRKDQIEQVHFDTRQYNHIVYETPEELREKLHHRIAATIQ